MQQKMYTPIDRGMIFNRAERLLGPATMQALSELRVIIFGVGGVGSWTAEALARTGVGHLTLVDADRVAPSNINRQAQANVATVGEVKVEVLARMLRGYNPELDVKPIEMEYNDQTADEIDLEEYDFVVDAIDSLGPKALLINRATRAARKTPQEADSVGIRRPILFSSMGAALKVDPEKIVVAEFRNVTGCRLAAALRRRFKKSGEYPARKFRCVYSPEMFPNRGEAADSDPAMGFNKVAVNGSLCHITAIFGMTLAGLIIREVASRE